jgi:hypothetical protein
MASPDNSQFAPDLTHWGFGVHRSECRDALQDEVSFHYSLVLSTSLKFGAPGLMDTPLSINSMHIYEGMKVQAEERLSVIARVLAAVGQLLVGAFEWAVLIFVFLYQIPARVLHRKTGERE